MQSFGIGNSTEIEVPFEFRHRCWFCGEPSQYGFIFPHEQHVVIACSHPQLTVPSCGECLKIANQPKVDSLSQVRFFVKAELINVYRKDLAIGIHWTPESLAESGFEGGNFEGFQKSAWMMYEIARDRINFPGWPIVYQGVNIDIEQDKEVFVFDGIEYPSIDQAIEHYCKSYDLNKAFFKKVLLIKGSQNFAATVRLCRIYVGATPQERSAALNQLTS